MAVDMENLEFDPLELTRYARHLALPGWGEPAQKEIKNASVLVVGLGGLGSVASLYLAMAGVGRIGLVDQDLLSLSNLQRQPLYMMGDVDRPKAFLAKKRLGKINPTIQYQAYHTRLTSENAVDLIKEYDVILDGSDNFSTRVLLNETCCELNKPYVYGAVSGFDGQVSVFHASQGPCLRCLFPTTAEHRSSTSKEHLAVLNTVPAMIGAVQATQALKQILGVGGTLLGRLYLFNALDLSWQAVEIPKRKHCQVCG